MIISMWDGEVTQGAKPSTRHAPGTHWWWCLDVGPSAHSWLRESSRQHCCSCGKTMMSHSYHTKCPKPCDGGMVPLFMSSLRLGSADSMPEHRLQNPG